MRERTRPDLTKAVELVTQAGGNLRGRLPKVARRVNRDLGKVEKDCRKAAPKEKQVGETCESNPRARRESNIFNANYGVGHGGRVEWSSGRVVEWSRVEGWRKRWKEEVTGGEWLLEQIGMLFYKDSAFTE
ncbi:MAG: hypothetical protein EBY32_08165 [Proteobacteria bacterium]|nr:hypothetical protein [Pseudomonadota bacterium]